MTRRTAVIAALTAIALGVWLLWPKPKLSDEAQLRAIVADCAKAAGEHDLSKLVAPVSRRYHGEFGDRDGLKSALGYMLLSTRDLKVLPTNVQVEVDGPKAKVDFVVGLAQAGGAAGSANLGSRFIHAEFEKTPDGWQAVSATSREATGRDLVP